MTSKVVDTPVDRDWIELKLQASLKDYVSREVHDRDFKELRDEDKAIRKAFAEGDEKVDSKAKDAFKTASEAKAVAGGLEASLRSSGEFSRSLSAQLLADPETFSSENDSKCPQRGHLQTRTLPTFGSIFRSMISNLV